MLERVEFFVIKNINHIPDTGMWLAEPMLIWYWPVCPSCGPCDFYITNVIYAQFSSVDSCSAG